ncbi:uroporphyrinogen-III C-methyltransferase [Demequina sp. TTPB684]|uniref:uroporphyrinogen-III C-methyltransferase n=1 Tax=unclassified Demequina TaxID=2620311 RepID=UPI001CF33037|nr:uroporphyrinogen-III C-methyltransferase [Demequina sp. TMPB413]MCB2412109.1 uroporphyrinogen-III C-methyltransferase [Demequina sp. TTPB684]UPU88896.1 uroporphyrinogen-III C-methyltransferase [Demequina sp. TMPB413]
MNPLVSLDVTGRRVVVAGAGSVGTRRARALVAAGADVVVVSPQATDDIAQLARHGDLTWHARTVAATDAEGAWLVIAATDNPTANADLCRWCEEHKVWCINASDATRSPARMAAQVAHGDLALGVVSLGNADPRRAVRVRDVLSATIEAGEVDLRHVRSRAGRVVLVGSGPGADDLITVRGLRFLSEADVVVVDRLGATGLLDRLPEDVEVINVGKSPDNHPVPQAEINALLVARALEGKTVVRLKGGDPYVFGRGGEEVHACLAAGIDVEVVPGVTSALAVPAAAGIPVTQRGITASVLITSGHAGPDAAACAAMSAGATVVVLMGVTALGQFVTAALDGGVAGDTSVAIIEKGTTSHERITRATVSTIVRIAEETGVKPPAIIVIGQVAHPDLLASEIAATR